MENVGAEQVSFMVDLRNEPGVAFMDVPSMRVHCSLMLFWTCWGDVAGV